MYVKFVVLSCAEARDRLRKLREDQLRRSDEVVELWEEFLDCVHYKLGTECMHYHVLRCDIGRSNMSNSINVFNFHIWIVVELFRKQLLDLVDLFIKQYSSVSINSFPKSRMFA